MKCRSCDTKLKEFFSLGKMPLVNSFLRKENLHKERKYNLSIGVCPHCFLVQLIKNISPEELFTDYIYASSTSASFLEHCRENAKKLTAKLGLKPGDSVLEIASNDGAQLQYFKELQMNILGVDPAQNIAVVANQKGIETIPDFFSTKLAQDLKQKRNIAADLVFGANVLAHVPGINDFLKGVNVILKPKGTAVFEFPYVRGLFENKFDTIYHEHVFYYSLLSLTYLFHSAGLDIYDVELTPVQGGSLLIFAAHQGVFSPTDRVAKLICQEKRSRYHKVSAYRVINKNVNKLKANLMRLLKKIKSEGKSIAAYSAPAKGNILLNYFKINNNHIDFIVDKAKEKQGLYTPGTHFLVHTPEEIDRKQPDYLLVLCWNIHKEILWQLKDYRDKGGKFIIPIPRVILV